MKKILTVFIFLIVISMSVPPNAFALFSLVDDWSNATNPNGPWSYNEGNNPLQFNIPNWPFGEFGSSQTAWANSNNSSDAFPGWFKSVSNPVGFNGPYDWLEGDVIVHAMSASNDIANVTWTSPFSGTYDISGGLWMGRDIGRADNWSLFLDNVLLDSGSLFSGDIYSRANPDSFNFQGVNISQGSILKIEVVRNPGEDFVGVDFNINERAEPVIPEPSTILLLGSGFLGAYIRRRRLLIP